jgi:hypothetical protein
MKSKTTCDVLQAEDHGAVLRVPAAPVGRLHGRPVLRGADRPLPPPPLAVTGLTGRLPTPPLPPLLGQVEQLLTSWKIREKIVFFPPLVGKVLTLS